MLMSSLVCGSVELTGAGNRSQSMHPDALMIARRLSGGSRHGFIEDDDNVFRFRNAEASNVRRTHVGVPLGSSQVEREERKLAQQQLVEEDKMTDWKTFYVAATVVTLLYTLLQWSVDSGTPYEPTVYEPYVPRTASREETKAM
jgi:hypothetical protein